MHEIEKEVKKLREELQKLHFEYTQFFRGNRKKPPLKERSDFDKKITALSRKKFFTHAPKYLIENLMASYVSYSSLWEKIMKQIEEGKFERGRGWVSKKELDELKKREEKSVSAKSEEDRYLHVIEEYREMKEACEGKPPNIEFEKFRAQLSKAEKKAKEIYKCEKVDFRVVVENGKVKIKAVPKK